MNCNFSPVSSSNYETKTFNNHHSFIQGWYWAIPSRQLGVGEVKSLNLLGKDLVLYRREDKTVIAQDADCFPGDRGKFDTKSWATGEKYGMVWVWTGDIPKHPLPFVPELEHDECDAVIATGFVKNCHPNVVMINAIDAQHFNTVHNLPVKIFFHKQELHQNAIAFSNTTRGGDESWFVKLIRPLYKNEITYSMCYWYGSTGTVTVGPDFLHFYIMFALRLTAGGKTEGQTILITKKRPGVWGWVFNRVVLWLTQLVGNYFAKGDTKVFQTIKFDFKTPIKADEAIIQFIQHLEKQESLAWGTWRQGDKETRGITGG
jgi:phenylpropionate dioxygenase-like ring-hydroxylating dioxygenase large terminal subunit